MALELATFIGGLVTTNPLGATDPKSQGDDHIRLLKSAIKATFTNATRAFRFPEVPSAKTGAYTIALTDQHATIRGDASGGAFSITLPLGSAVFAGFEVTVQKSDSSSNAVTVDGNGAETINGAADRVLSSQFHSERYVWDGSEWKVLAFYAGSLLAIDGENSQVNVIGTVNVTGTVNATAFTIAGAAFTAIANTFTAAQRGVVTALTSIAASVAIALDDSNNYQIAALQENTTLANSTDTPVAGQGGVIVVIQDGTGGWTMAFGSEYQAEGGIANIVLSTSPNARDELTYYVEDSTHVTISIQKDVKNS